jgi:hypothetical protein
MKKRHLAAIIPALILIATVVSAQGANPRLGKWNIMTYEAWGNGGMKVTVESTNREGKKSTWTYNTMFDGKDMPVSGGTRTETTAVKKIDKAIYERIQ